MHDELYEAAKILYEQTGNYGRLALCLVSLGEFAAAAAAAEKAATTQTWKVVCYSCVDAGEFELAQKCAVRVASRQEDLQELITHYTQHGYFVQLLGALEETAASSEKPHIALLTALGLLYCEHSPEKLMRYLQSYVARLNGSEVFLNGFSTFIFFELCFVWFFVFSKLFFRVFGCQHFCRIFLANLCLIYIFKAYLSVSFLIIS